jgi:DNA polymerase
MTKATEYARLVVERKACRRCQGLVNPADVGGIPDPDQVGPWSIWQGNLDARVMVVGQDWGDVAYFKKYQGRDVAHNFTNRALVELLAVAGISVLPLDSADLKHVAFFTNAILCLKSGGLQGKVDRSWFHNCGSFLRRQIEIVQPRVVVGLGERAYRSVLAEWNIAGGGFREEVELPEGRRLQNGTRVFAVYHCGARVRNTWRTRDQQERDWRRMAVYAQGAG